MSQPYSLQCKEKDALQLYCVSFPSVGVLQLKKIKYKEEKDIFGIIMINNTLQAFSQILFKTFSNLLHSNIFSSISCFHSRLS